MSNLAQRILTAVIAAPLALALAWLGGWGFALLVIAAAALAQREVYNLMRPTGVQPLLLLGLILGALAAGRVLIPGALPLLVVGSLVVLVGGLVGTREQPILDVAGTLFGVFYPALLLGYGVVLREAESFRLDVNDGFWLVATVLISVWGADTFAYAAGRLFGTHPLFPRVSPKKTWEGALGGLVGAVVVVAAFKVLALPVLSWLDVGVLGLCAGVGGPLGDLAESLFKRAAGVKDSGRSIPGHGGMLDRLDAAAVTVPLAALYLDHVAGLF
ncbi:MAG: phosphatidate cytidylyltransferase [Rhodothermaceae bacterium]|nr:phosphatidate cytidylyltransferase [Rhodothermaceae bacterium]